MAKRNTEQELITRFKQQHGNKGGYSKIKYFGMTGPGTAVEIFCRNHQQYFWQTPASHLSNWGCWYCNPKSNSVAHNLTRWFPDGELEVFASIDKFTIIEYLQLNQVNQSAPGYYNPIKRYYDYSAVPAKFISMFDPVPITCLDHNCTFFQSPINHVRNIKNSGCPYCSSVSKRKFRFEDKQASVFYIRVKNNYKVVATTKELKDEFKSNYKNISEVFKFETMDGVEALEEEQKIMAHFANHIVTNPTLLRSYRDTRYFDTDVLNLDNKGTTILF